MGRPEKRWVRGTEDLLEPATSVPESGGLPCSGPMGRPVSQPLGHSRSPCRHLVSRVLTFQGWREPREAARSKQSSNNKNSAKYVSKI